MRREAKTEGRGRKPLDTRHPTPPTRPSTPDPRPSATTRILGIDPGLRVTGFGVIDKNGSRLTYVASGRIRTPEAALDRRLKTILDGLAEVIAEHRPAQVTIEKVFVNVNPSSTLLLGQARGAALTALVSNDMNVSEYTALQMKKAIVGSGHAHKSQVQAMVQRLLSLSAAPAKGN